MVSMLVAHYLFGQLGKVKVAWIDRRLIGLAVPNF
jgi:hypothetical protein